MSIAQLRIASMLTACAFAVGCASAPPPSVAGTYDTKVSISSSSAGCTLPVEDNPTEVQLSDSDKVVLLRHGGTTYGGALTSGRSFTTQPRTVVVNGVSYSIVVSGQVDGKSLDATVTLDYGEAPTCHVVVRWAGPKRS